MKPNAGALSVCAALLTAACGSSEPPLAPATGAPVRVETALAAERPFLATYRASGTVRGRSTATLTSKSVGFVRVVHVRPGDLVRQGAALAELEASDVRAAVARARAALASALAGKVEAEGAVHSALVGVKLAKTQLERASDLRRQEAIAQAELDTVEARFQSVTAEEQMARARLSAVTSGIEQARAALAETAALLGYTKIVAPFSGRVLERLVDEGALASPGTPLFVLADDDRPRVEVAIPEARAGDLEVGTKVSVEIDGAPSPLASSVGEIVPHVDAASRAFLVKIDLPVTATQLTAGAFARVTLPIGSQTHLAVPASALSRFGALERVFVVEGGRAKLRMVTAGEGQAPWVRVLSGLSAGERVVQAPPGSLRDGSRVEVAP